MGPGPGPRRLSSVPTGRPHEILIVRGSAYSTGTGSNTGHRANLGLPWHYPVEAHCAVCGQVVSREEMAVERTDWVHTGRMPGEPGVSAGEDPDPCPVDGGSHDWETFTYTSPGTGGQARARRCRKCKQEDDL